MSVAECIRVPALSDNYIWLLSNPSSDEVAVVDPGDAGAVMAALEERGLTPTEIVNTHHHADHTDGNAELMERFGVPLTAPAAETGRIDGVTRAVRHGERVAVAGFDAEVIDTPGHTSGHVAFFLKDFFGGHGLVLAGDTLFSLGCGRVFEGSMEQMWASMLALRELPDDTVVTCGHEYSEGNARYVESLGWPRKEARERCAEINALRAEGKPTVPVALGVEKRANPFLNCDQEDLAAALGLDAKNPVEVFTALRKGKDSF